MDADICAKICVKSLKFIIYGNVSGILQEYFVRIFHFIGASAPVGLALINWEGKVEPSGKVVECLR